MQLTDRPQPAHDIIRARGLRMTAVAAEIGVSRDWLRDVLLGRVPIGNKVRERLPQILGLPLEELFDPDRIERRADATGARRAEIVRRGLSGESSADIASDHDLSVRTIDRMIAEGRRADQGIPRPKLVPQSPTRDREIIQRRAAGEAVRLIAYSYGITPARVYEILNGRPYRTY